MLLLLVCCDKGGGSGDSTPTPESVFSIDSTSPANNDLNVATNATVKITFSEAVAASTVNSSTFKLTYGGGDVVGTISCSGTNAIFTPATALNEGYKYDVVVNRGISSTGGVPLPSEYKFSFFTVHTDLSASPWSMFGYDCKHTGQSIYSGPLTADLKWNFRTRIPATDGIGLIGSTVIGGYAGGTVYFGASDSNVYALDTANGIRRWVFKTGGAIRSTPAIGLDGTIYVGSSDGNFYAIDAVTGAQLWVFPFNLTGEEAEAGSPVISPDGTVIFCGDGTLYALDRSTGAQKWLFFSNSSWGSYMSTPAVGIDGTVYLCGNNILSANSYTYALDGDTGTLKWETDSEVSIFSYSNSPAIGADGTVYVGGMEVQALDGVTGAEKWSFTGDDTMGYSTPVIGANGTLYIGSLNGNVYALDSSTGSQIWKFTTNNSLDSFMGLSIGADGTVYAGDRSSKLYALDGDTGSPIWVITLSPMVSCPAIGVDGFIYVACMDGTVYAVGE